jgi:hypothetical protein
VTVCGKTTTIKLHRLLLGFPKNEVDHKDGDGLNNRRSNLRKATKSQNQHNRKVNKASSSGCKGVFPNGNKWEAGIGINGRRKYLGLFSSIAEAAIAYDAAAEKHYGGFSKPNLATR